ncbi:uncharacterized protein [Eleutherodactylus coqui]|uniref:uncharacterized protein n=1 Tax=Eleutherodactylus coqui TaxID=57060 RepID=UPI0034617D19
MEAILEKIRAEAEERGLDWLVQLSGEALGAAAVSTAAAAEAGAAGARAEAAGGAEAAAEVRSRRTGAGPAAAAPAGLAKERPRRARAPERLSPEHAPSRRQRLRSASPAPPRSRLPPATPTGRGSRAGRTPAKRRGAAGSVRPRAERGAGPSAAQKAKSLEGVGGCSPGGASEGEQPCNSSSDGRPTVSRGPAAESSGRRATATEVAYVSSAPRRSEAVAVPAERSQPGVSRVQEEQRQDWSAAGGSTAPTQPVGAVPDTGAGCGEGGEEVPVSNLERGKRAVGGLIERSLARRTRAAYCAVWSEWEEWLRQHGGERSEEDRVGLLLSWLGESADLGRSVAKVNQFIAGVAFGFKIRGVEDATKNFLVKQALKGLRRGKGRQDTRRPVSFDVLEKLGEAVDVVCGKEFERRLFRAAFSFAFFGALRVSELVSPSKTVGGGLQAEDVRLVDGRLDLLIRRSKTDQQGRGQVIRLGEVPGASMCPLSAWEQYSKGLNFRTGPFLRHETGEFLSRFQFIAVFKKALEVAGFNNTQFGSHSFRVGAATEASVRGMGEEAVKRIGRWESGRFKSYVRPHLL